MAKKLKSEPAGEEPYPRKSVEITLADGATKFDAGRAHAKTVCSPEIGAYRIINAAESHSGLGKGIDVPSLLDILREQGKAVHSGDLSQAEAMLMNQATALQTLFSALTQRALTADYMPHFEAFMRLGLKAQGQCRATLETLAAIKNPPVVIARQANIAHGPQQVNIGNGSQPPPRAGETENQPTQLEHTHGDYLDTRATAAASGTDPANQAVGEIDRAEDSGRQGP